MDGNGRIHPDFMHTVQLGARISVVRPNMQNIPKEGVVREVFIASEGCKIVQADFSQLEVCIIATLSNERKILDTLEKRGDIHSQTSMAVFGKKTGKYRDMSKRLNYGCIYGITEHGLSKNFSINIDKAMKILSRFHNTYDSLYKWSKETHEEVAIKRYVRSANGRLLHCDYTHPFDLERHQRRAVSWKIQSFSADVTIWCMNELSRMGWAVILQVHDSIAIDCPESEVPRCMADMRKVMTRQASERFGVKLRIDFKVGDHL
jgi:DNA polymerase-1